MISLNTIGELLAQESTDVQRRPTTRRPSLNTVEHFPALPLGGAILPLARASLADDLLVTYLSAVVTVPLGARFHCLYQLNM